jgi:ribonuclease Z
MSVRDLTILGCSSQQPTRLRNHGAYLFRWNGEGFLFDPGELSGNLSMQMLRLPA